jgi:hypothetical protein
LYRLQADNFSSTKKLILLKWNEHEKPFTNMEMIIMRVSR